MPHLSRRAARIRAAVIICVAVLCALPQTALAKGGQASPPLMGWSSWDFLRHTPSEASVEAQAQAMVSSGLKSVGYRYVNLDDYWYSCPGPQGPDVDRYGRWVINSSLFPSQGSVNGIKATADDVHSLGLKFGIYVTPGISKQAVAEHTPIKGTRYTANEIATSRPESNYNCHGMVGIDYAKPGAQAFIDSWAQEFANWGVDYVKIDGVGSGDIPDIAAWSQALRRTGRPIHLELSNNLNIADASTWRKYAGGWRTGGDIDCYCSQTSYPLTDWANVLARFDEVAEWAPYGHSGEYNDYDSVEVGNGAEDGLTPPERQTQLSLWSLGASPLILGSDLTHLDPLDRSYLLNRAVISVDQDGIDAHRIVNTGTTQVFTKTERSGDVVVGLFNLSGRSRLLWTSASALGLAAHHRFFVDNLWTHGVSDTTGRIGAEVPSHGVALLRITRASSRAVAPLTTVSTSGPATATGADTVTERVMFTNAGSHAATGVHLSLSAPAGWTVSARSPVTFASVAPGKRVSARFAVSVPEGGQPFVASTLTGTATDASAAGQTSASSHATLTVTGSSVRAPFATYSSARDAPARFSQIGSEFGIEGAGASLWSSADDYSAIYERGGATSSSTITTELTGEQNLTGYAKAGIIVRNHMAAAGTAPEGVVLYDSPSGGVQLEWDHNGGRFLDAVTPRNGTIREGAPVFLRLVRRRNTYTGLYSTSATGTWHQVGRVTLPRQDATQDAGLFEVSQALGLPGVATFDGFSVS